MTENKLTNEILDLRSQCNGRGIIYVLLTKGSSEVSVFSPKTVMTLEDRDTFLKYLLESADFKGRITDPSSVWKTIVKDPWSRDYYRLTLEGDSFIEITTTKMSEIIKTPL